MSFQPVKSFVAFVARRFNVIERRVHLGIASIFVDAAHDLAVQARRRVAEYAQRARRVRVEVFADPAYLPFERSRRLPVYATVEGD